MKSPSTKVYKYKGSLKVLFTEEYNPGGGNVNNYVTKEDLVEFGKNFVTEEMLEKRLQQFGIDLEQKLEKKIDEKLEKALAPINSALIEINKTLEKISKTLVNFDERLQKLES